jgi:hypothetical protein
MRKLIQIVVLLGTLAALLLGMQSLTASEKKLVHFSIIVVQTEDGWEMTCQRGCAWERLRYSCGEGDPCAALVDETGVRGHHPAQHE